DLGVLDPIWTTAYIARNHGYLVFDTLFGTDEQHRIRPQMVDRFAVSANGMTYTFTLRDGLRWHDGQPVVSEDCVESVKRWGKNGCFRPACHEAHGENRAGRQEDVHDRPGRAFRARPRGPRQALDQRPVHDAGADRRHVARGPDQGDRRLRAIQVREGRVAAA